MTDHQCPHCGRYASVTAAIAAVNLHRTSWAGSPAPWLGGPFSALADLVEAGMARRTPAGWYVPTDTFPARMS